MDEPAFWGGFAGAPGCVADALGVEGPALVWGFEGVGCCAVASCAHVAQAWDAQFKCFCGLVCGYSLNVVDEAFLLEDGLPGRWVVCE